MIKALLLSTVLLLATITGTQNAQAQHRTEEFVAGALILGLGIAAIAESRRRHRHHYREHYRGHYFVPHHHHRHHLDHPHLYREHHYHRRHYR